MNRRLRCHGRHRADVDAEPDTDSRSPRRFRRVDWFVARLGRSLRRLDAWMGFVMQRRRGRCVRRRAFTQRIDAERERDGDRLTKLGTVGVALDRTRTVRRFVSKLDRADEPPAASLDVDVRARRRVTHERVVSEALGDRFAKLGVRDARGEVGSARYVDTHLATPAIRMDGCRNECERKPCRNRHEPSVLHAGRLLRTHPRRYSRARRFGAIR